MAVKGAYGIKRVAWSPSAIICLQCYRSWLEDITPAGRCPWEHIHGRDRQYDVSRRRRNAVMRG